MKHLDHMNTSPAANSTKLGGHNCPSQQPENFKKMNRTKTSTIIVAGILSLLASPLGAAPATTTAWMFPVSAANTHGKASIKIGTWRGDVMELLRAPNERITPDVWLFRNFHANLPVAESAGCTDLIVVFKEGRISEMRLVNGRAEAVIVARMESGTRTPTALLAAVKQPSTPAVATN